MTTVRLKKPSTSIRPQAPTVGSHLPTPKERMAAQTEIQMNRRPKMYFPPPPRLKKNALKVATAVMHNVPPSQIGFATQ